MSFNSKLLNKKSPVLSIPACAAIEVNHNTIAAALEQVFSHEKQRASTWGLWIDNDIVGYFENQTMPAIEQPFTSAIYSLSEGNPA